MQEKILRLREMLPRYANVRRLRKEYDKKTAEMAQCMEECRKASEVYEDRYRDFSKGRQVLWRKIWKRECPAGMRFYSSSGKGGTIRTCTGSDEVEQVKKLRDQAEQKRSRIQETYQSVRADLAAGEAALGENPPAEEEAKAQLNNLEQQLKDEKERGKTAQEHTGNVWKK